MIRETVREFWRVRHEGRWTHKELVQVRTYWFLFIPVYSRQRIVGYR